MEAVVTFDSGEAGDGGPHCLTSPRCDGNGRPMTQDLQTNAALTRCPRCNALNRVPIVTGGRPRCGKCQEDLPWLVEVTAKEFDAVVHRSAVPVLVDLWAPWCGPCRMVAPALQQLAVERAGTLRIAKVNVDEQPTVSAQLGVKGIPTMVLYSGGAEVGRQVGALPTDRIGRWVDDALASNVG